MFALYAWVLLEMKSRYAVFHVLMVSMLIAWTTGYSGVNHAAQYASVLSDIANNDVENGPIEHRAF